MKRKRMSVKRILLVIGSIIVVLLVAGVLTLRWFYRFTLVYVNDQWADDGYIAFIDRTNNQYGSVSLYTHFYPDKSFILTGSKGAFAGSIHTRIGIGTVGTWKAIKILLKENDIKYIKIQSLGMYGETYYRAGIIRYCLSLIENPERVRNLQKTKDMAYIVVDGARVEVTVDEMIEWLEENYP